MVAIAAPATFNLQIPTNRISRTILTIQQMIKQFNGVLESPIALKTLEPTL